MKQLEEIKATVEAEKTPPKAPPPPPPDLVKPPPPVAIVPDFTVATAPPPAAVTTAPKPPPAPPPKAVATSDPLRPIGRTRTLPPYPPISVRLNESGTTLMEVHITTEGNVDDCKVITSSSSERLDTGRLRSCQARVALAAADQSGPADRRFDTCFGQMGSQGRPLTSQQVTVTQFI